MNFFQKPAIPQHKPKENCKIKIKKTATGKTIEFEGNCTKEQLQMAKMNMDNPEEVEEDDF